MDLKLNSDDNSLGDLAIPVFGNRNPYRALSAEFSESLPYENSLSQPAFRSASKLKDGFDQKATHEHVPKLPNYYERHSSFQSSKQPIDILQALSRFFTEENIEHDCNAQKYKIKAVVFVRNIRCGFVVKVYKSPSRNRFVVEFQRRSGCVVAFRDFYTRTLCALGDVVSDKKPDKRMAELDAFASAAGQLAHVDLDAETISILLAMANDENPELEVEAMRILARAVRDDKNLVTISAGISIVPFLVSKLKSDQEDVVHIASELLVRFSDWDKVQPELMKDILVPVSEVLTSLAKAPRLGDKPAQQSMLCSLSALSKAGKFDDASRSACLQALDLYTKPSLDHGLQSLAAEAISQISPVA